MSVKCFGGFKVLITYPRKRQNFLKNFLLPSLLCSVGKLGFSLWAGSSLSVGDVANLVVAENQPHTSSPGAGIPDYYNNNNNNKKGSWGYQSSVQVRVFSVPLVHSRMTFILLWRVSLCLNM